MSDTPLSYAKSIAYIGDASTIRVLTIRMHGRAPRLEICRRIVAERAAKVTQFQVRSKRASANRSADGGTRGKAA